VSQIGGPMRARPLHFFLLLDCSSSMNVGGKIQALNAAIAEALPIMRTEAEKNPQAEVLVRVITFSTGASWHVAEPTPIASFVWNDVAAGGDTHLGAALALVSDVLRIPPMPERALPPVLVLISDGRPTDREFPARLDELLALPWGRRSVRIAIAIGRDADEEILRSFIGAGGGTRPLQANSPEDLADLVRWTATVVLREASQPAVGHGTATGPLAKPPPPNDLLVWGEDVTR
jgi:uncharacterized protein YegL